MKNIGYKLVKNYTQTAEKAPYTGMALPVGSLAFDNILAGMLDSGTFMTKSTAEYFLKAFFEFAADEIGANVVRVSTGTVALYPAISGSFPSEDAAFDPLKNALYVGASVSQTLRDRVAGVEPGYEGDAAEGSSVKLSSVMDLESKIMGVIDGTKAFRLAGVDLTVPDGADESLSLVLKDGLTKVCDITVSENDGGLYLKCALPGTAPIAKGTYKIRLVSHGLDPTAPLAVRTLAVTLVSAVTPVLPPAITKVTSPAGEGVIKVGQPMTVEGVSLGSVTQICFQYVTTGGSTAALSRDCTLEGTTKAKVAEVPAMPDADVTEPVEIDIVDAEGEFLDSVEDITLQL